MDRTVYFHSDTSVSEGASLYRWFHNDTLIGTVASHGTGGLLNHWQHSATDPDRQIIYDALDQMFTALSGQAPSTLAAEVISFRYDLLFIIRSLKETLTFLPPVPTEGYMKTVIQNYS